MKNEAVDIKAWGQFYSVRRSEPVICMGEKSYKEFMRLLEMAVNKGKKK